MPNSHALPPISESSLLSADHFMDVANASPLLANHGAGIERGSRLEVLTPPSVPSYVDHQRIHLHGSASGCSEPCNVAAAPHGGQASLASGFAPAEPQLGSCS
jgi:hypothetical protein